MSKGYVIVAKYRGQPPEVVDHADERSEAEYLRTEYALAFGIDASVSMRKATQGEAQE